MSDALIYLDGIASRVSTALLPSELKDVATFLMGKQWLTASGQMNARGASDAAATKVAVNVRVPNGLLAWHGYIPLAIGATSTISVLSTDGRAALSDFFLKEGFANVFAVNFTSNASASAASFRVDGHEDSHHQGTSSAQEEGAAPGAKRSKVAEQQRQAASATTAANHVRHRLNARVQCMDAIRRFCSVVEEEARADTREQGEHSNQKQGYSSRKRPLREGDEGVAEGAGVREVRRLLVVVRCCADNRTASSTAALPVSSCGGGHRMSGRSRTGDGAGGVTARRHRHGSEPLYLLLHDIAAVLSLSDARLAHTGWRVRVGVLVLPDDQVYGGALLARRLKEEVGHRYCVRLFKQGREESAEAAGNHQAEGEGKQPASPLASRARRVLRVWEPAALYALPTNAAEASANGEPADREVTPSQLATTLLRCERFFFLRPSNLPLCCFLREALRLFPMLAPPTILQQWQVLWTARHSLQDVLLGFHSVLMPFTHAAAFADAVDDAWRRGTSNVGEKEGGKSVAPPEVMAPAAARQRKQFADLLGDATDLLDALLEASASLGSNSELDEAVWFMLLYEELVQRRGVVRLSRIPPVANALAALYDKESRIRVPQTRKEQPSQVSLGSAAAVGGEQASLSVLEKARCAIGKLLPFYRPSPLILADGTESHGMPDTLDETRCANRDASQVTLPSTPAARHRAVTALPSPMQFVNLNAPMGPALQQTLLSALQSPSVSLLEMQAATAAFQESASAAFSGISASHINPHASYSPQLLSPNNFYGPLVPDSVRVLYLLTAHAVGCRTDKQKYIPVVQLQQICQLSDERLLLVLRELQLAGLATVNLREQTARTTLSA